VTTRNPGSASQVPAFAIWQASGLFLLDQKITESVKKELTFHRIGGKMKS